MTTLLLGLEVEKVGVLRNSGLRVNPEKSEKELVLVEGERALFLREEETRVRVWVCVRVGFKARTEIRPGVCTIRV